MFGFLKRRKAAPPTARDLKATVADAEIELQRKWLQFVQTVHFKDGVSLSSRIEAFAPLAQEFIRRQHPLILTGPAGAFWLLIFNAVRESGTNTVDEINVAVRELRQKFAGTGQ